MSERDPRQEPRIGDFLIGASNNLRRVVIAFDYDGDVIYTQYYRSGRLKDGCCSVASWRRWANGADVLRRGKDA